MIKQFYDTRVRRRVIFVLVNALACSSVFGLVILPTSAFFGERDGHIANQRKTLARLNAISAQFENVQSITSETNTQIRGGEFLSGPNENVIGADLQTKLKSVVEAGGARSRAAQALPVRTGDLLRYIGTRVEVAGNLQSLHRAIYAIENAKPYLFILGATIKPSPSVVKQGGTEEPLLQAQLEVFGAVQVGREP
jgi:general secretion pathway protein M